MPPKNSKLIHEWIPEGGGDFDVIVIGLQESSYREKTSSNLSGHATVPLNGEEPPSTAGGEASGSRSGSPRKEEAAAPKAATDWDSETDECCENGIAGSPTRSTRRNDEDEDGENEGADDDHDDQELGAALTEAREAVRRSSRSSSPHLQKLSATSVRTGGDDGEGDEASESPTATTKSTLDTAEVIIKRSRTKKSMRKVSKLVRQVSSNLRESVADVLDYAFNKQIYLHLGENYALIGKVELMEMRLFAYVHTRHVVSGIEKISVPTGLGSVLGNKVRSFVHIAVALGPLRLIAIHHFCNRAGSSSSSLSRTRHSAS